MDDEREPDDYDSPWKGLVERYVAVRLVRRFGETVAVNSAPWRAGITSSNVVAIALRSREKLTLA